MEKIANQFLIKGEVKRVCFHQNGLVNKTFLVETSTNKYLLQEINNFVFKNVDNLMKNIEIITNYINKYHMHTLKLVLTKNHELYYQHHKQLYRCYEFIENAYSISSTKIDHYSLEVGKVIGDFQRVLINLNPSIISQTIQDFHDTPKRYQKLLECYKKHKRKEKSIIDELMTTIKQYESYIMKIQTAIDLKLIPERIVHNDTKLNNVMFNKQTHKAICLIDLDTVMPGCALFDFSDAVRTTSCLVNEDEQDFSKIKVDDKKFILLSTGYLVKMYDVLTDVELDLLYDAVVTITLECAIRFLTDYLEEDVYFKIDYPLHNLNRAQNQIILVKRILEKEQPWRSYLKLINKHFNAKSSNLN